MLKQLNEMSDEEFERKLTIIMGLFGFLLILNFVVFIPFINSKINERNAAKLSINTNVIPQTCVCSSRCALQVCYDDNSYDYYKEDNFILNNNLTKENCVVCRK